MTKQPIQIPNPDPALLKALRDAGALPPESPQAVPRRKPCRTSRPTKRLPPLRIEPQTSDEMLPAILIFLVLLILCCVMT